MCLHYFIECAVGGLMLARRLVPLIPIFRSASVFLIGDTAEWMCAHIGLPRLLPCTHWRRIVSNFFIPSFLLSCYALFKNTAWLFCLLLQYINFNHFINQNIALKKSISSGIWNMCSDLQWSRLPDISLPYGSPLILTVFVSEIWQVEMKYKCNLHLQQCFLNTSNLLTQFVGIVYQYGKRGSRCIFFSWTVWSLD